MNNYLFGIEEWDCGGYRLTPDMRREILLKVVELYVAWEANGVSYEWDMEAGRLAMNEVNDVATLGEFLDELTGDQHPLFRGDYLAYSDQLHDWLISYICNVWAGDIFEEDENDKEPAWEAESRVSEWLDGLLIEDVLAWRSAVQKAELQGADWRIDGF